MAYPQEYQYISDCIQDAKVDFLASESHGTACGLICGQLNSALTVWLENQLPPHDKDNAQLELLTRNLVELYNHTEQMLLHTDFEFSLFLPDDENLLVIRLEALGEWCSGFLLGLSMVGINKDKGLADDLCEFIDDLLDIARVSHVEVQEENVDEVAYMELVEYVRLGVISLYEEMLVQHDQSVLH